MLGYGEWRCGGERGRDVSYGREPNGEDIYRFFGIWKCRIVTIKKSDGSRVYFLANVIRIQLVDVGETCRTD